MTPVFGTARLSRCNTGICDPYSVLSPLRQWLRRRQLAGDGRAGQWAREQIRWRRWRYIRKHWRRLAAFALVVAVFTATINHFIASAFVRGLWIGVAVAGTAGVLTVLVIEATGTAPTSMGATAEQWTASELRPLRKRGWRLLNHVALQRWDIDHVLVGPGGVWAVETKWAADGWVLDPPSPRLHQALERVRGNARNLNYWHLLRPLGVGSVSPVLFLWGGRPDGPAKPTTPCRIGNVEVIVGVEAARAWRVSLQSAAPATLGPDRVQEICAVLDDHVRRRDEHEAKTVRAAPSLERIYWTALAVLLTASASFLLSLEAWGIAGSWWRWLLILAALTCPSAVGRWVRPLRWYAAAWLTGVLAALCCFAGLLVSIAV